MPERVTITPYLSHQQRMMKNEILYLNLIADSQFAVQTFNHQITVIALILK